MLVIKRDNSVQEFSWDKIRAVVEKAFNACKEPFNDEIFSDIKDELYIEEGITVEELQDQIEQSLFECGYFDVAKAFILYRDKHKELRFLKERSNYIDKCTLSNSNTATLSEVDANANVQNKNVATIEAEVYKGINKEIQRYKMKKRLSKMFPEVAEQYEKDLNSHIIYTHDESSSPVPKPYCVAVSMYPFFREGTSNLDGLGSSAPSNLVSFCGQFNNLVFLLSSQYKGAVAFGEFFNAFYYYCVKEWGEKFWEREQEINNCGSIKPKTISQTIEQAFQNIVYSINQPAGNRSFQSPFTNISYYDSNYWHSLFDEFVFPDGTKPVWEGVDYLQRKFIHWFNKEREKTLLTFPVESMALLSDGNDIIDKDYKQLTAEMYAAGHSFFTYISDNPDGLASCCRLRNSIEKNEFSFTNGLTGVATGSVNVITLNINRIVQDWCKSIGGVPTVGNQHDSLKFYLIDILERVYKYHIAYKDMLYELYEHNMLPAYTAGYISLNQQFSTIGINGINEAAEFLGITCSDNKEYEDFCALVTSTISEENAKHRSKTIKFNQEFVPAESLAIKNYNWDKKDKYWVPEDRNCYNSYFYKPDDPNISILERFRLQGKRYAGLMDGGVALHCNLNEHLTKDQYLNLIDYAIKNGTSYFTFNIPNSECKDCGFIVKRPIKTCPKCGGHNITWWTRIIGYLRPISSFSEGRQIEASKRVYL